jgi:hypothetical protein
VYHHLYRAEGWLAPERTGKLRELTRPKDLAQPG